MESQKEVLKAPYIKPLCEIIEFVCETSIATSDMNGVMQFEDIWGNG